MTNKLIVIILLFSIVSLVIPQNTFGFSYPDPDSGSTSVPGRLSCVGFWNKIICVAKKIADALKIVFRIKKVVDNLPHSFPFGGHILTSERACSLKFNEITWWGINYCPPGYCPFPTPFGPVPITIALGGRAIRVGEPVPIVPPTTSPYGRAIVFPWISDVYKNHAENRVGPWALGLGFTPFPLDEINRELGGIRFRWPPSIIDESCFIPDPSYFGRVSFIPLAICVENFRFECLDSGEFDQNGNPVYKVIRKLGTSP